MLLIDGYNLLFAARLGGDLTDQRARLIEALEKSGRRARIVFDHTKGPLVYGMAPKKKGVPVEVWFAEEGITADQEIIDMLRATPDRTAFTVVTSDRAIADVARKGKFEVIDSKEFWESLDRPAPPRDPKQAELLPGEVDFWMKEFGLDDEPPTSLPRR